MTITRVTPDDELTILRYINDHVRTHGYPPTNREITAALGRKSPSAANTRLRIMAERGLITTAPGIPRGLRITDAGMVALTEPV
jgi:repressor LexA